MQTINRVFGNLTFQVLLLFVFSFIAFYLHKEKLFFGMDGLGLRVASSLMAGWSGYVAGLSSNPFQGLGALYGLNVNLIPTLSLANYVSAPFGLIAAYSLAAVELYIGVYVLGRGLSLSPSISRLAGCILPLVCLPFFSNWQIYPVFNLAPNMAEVLAAITFGLGCFCISMNTTGRRRFIANCGIMFPVVWVFASQPTYLVLFVLTTFSVFLVQLFSNGSVRRSIIQALPILVILTLLLAISGFKYLLGIYTFTAAAIFSSELNPDVARSMYFTSILFQSHAHGEMGKFFAIASLIGAVLMAFEPSKRAVLMKLVIPVIPLGIVGLFFMNTSGNWSYPHPIYFEFSLWPLYSLLAAYAISKTYCLPSKVFGPSDLRHAMFVGIVLCGMVFLVVQESKPTGDILGRPPQETPITSHLSDAIGLNKDSTFRGYSANFSGNQGQEESLSWGKQVNQDVQIARETGNSHRLMGLWRYGIPTLEEYQPINNPFLFAFVSRLLSRDVDTQTRNLLMLSELRADLLQMMGIRYVIRDTPMDAPARLREKIAIANTFGLHLYELPRPNLGQYSPTQTIVAADATSTIDLMSHQNINYREVAVVSEPVEGELVPVESSDLSINAEGYRIKASSNGRSMLVIPIQFSNCLRANGDAAGTIKLLRANLILTGVIFDRELDVKLEKKISLISNSDCRWKDRQDAVTEKLKELEVL